MADEPQDSFEDARMLVIGVGGGGGNAVQHMVLNGVAGVDFLCANTDRKALNKLEVPNKFQLGMQATRGLGAGGNPEVGRASAEDDEEDLKAILQEYDMIFISAGMGGGTGTGAAPVIARIAKELDKLVVAVVTTPFKFEGGKRARAAKDGIEQLGNYVDSIVTVPNEKVQSVYRNLTVIEAFKKADDVLLSGVDGLVRAIRSVGTINLDFNDVRTLMKETKGHAMMGIGRASGDDRARQATEKAIRSPLTDNLRLENAKGLLVSMKGVLTMEDPAEVAAIVEDLVNIDEADIFYGIVIDETMGDDFEVTVIATGLTLDDRPKVAPAVKAPTQQATAQPQVAPTAPQPRVSTPKKQMDVGDYLRNRMATD